MPNADFEPLWYFINERHAIYLRKKFTEIGELPEKEAETLTEYDLSLANGPSVDDFAKSIWTKDPILSKYRFCNVFRELDRVTLWIRENIQEPFKDHQHLWFMLAIARYINWPASLKELIDNEAWPNNPNFKPSQMSKVLERRKERGEKCETGAFMIRAESDRSTEWFSWPKQRYVSEIVLGNLWNDRDKLQGLIDQDEQTLEVVWLKLQEYRGWGPFMSGQLVTDLRHSRYLKEAPDLNKWTALGPGSRRGLNRLFGRSVESPLKQEDGVKELTHLREIAPEFIGTHVPLPELSDFQNCCCEVDKYLRVKLRQGEPRSRYVPGRGW